MGGQGFRVPGHPLARPGCAAHTPASGGPSGDASPFLAPLDLPPRKPARVTGRGSMPDRIWGGSNLAAGSDSESGSSLPWTRLRDIAEPIVAEAWRRAGRNDE